MAIEIYEGLKFGRMTVLGFNEEETKKIKNQDKIWICRCSCGKIRNFAADTIRKAIKNNANSTCGLCYTFEDWCLDNDHQDYLDLWDYELNKFKPSEIGFGTHRKYWFKCEKGIHDSELWNLNIITSNNKKSSCRKCNSIGQYLLDTYGNLGMWSDKNTVDPFEISRSSGRKVIFKCLDCCKDKSMGCNVFVKNNSIRCLCSDGFNYPNKFVTSLLIQLNIQFDTEKIFDWAENKKYDHYIPYIDCIIENHGQQHYMGWFNDKNDLDRQTYNDKFKQEIALNNNVSHYIQLDCRISKLKWIKSSIMDSDLPKLLNFTEDEIDWLECDRYALNNKVKEVCSLWMTGKFNTTTELSKHIKLDRTTVIRYLKDGVKHEWCDYDPKEEVRKSNSENGKMNQIPICMTHMGSEIIFKSATECERQSVDRFGIKLDHSAIAAVCRGKRKSYKGFTFRYVDSPEQSANE